MDVAKYVVMNGRGVFEMTGIEFKSIVNVTAKEKGYRLNDIKIWIDIESGELCFGATDTRSMLIKRFIIESEDHLSHIMDEESEPIYFTADAFDMVKNKDVVSFSFSEHKMYIVRGDINLSISDDNERHRRYPDIDCVFENVKSDSKAGAKVCFTKSCLEKVLKTIGNDGFLTMQFTVVLP